MTKVTQVEQEQTDSIVRRLVTRAAGERMARMMAFASLPTIHEIVRDVTQRVHTAASAPDTSLTPDEIYQLAGEEIDQTITALDQKRTK